MTTLNCKFCDATFEVKTSRQKYCSRVCSRKHWYISRNPEGHLTLPCVVCGTVFTRTGVKSKVTCTEPCLKRLWYLNNKERLDDYRNEWAKKNLEKQRAYINISKAKKPEHYAEMRRHHENKRSARKANAGGSHTTEQWIALVEQMDEQCLRCKKPGTFRTLTKDHVMPISLGGSDDISNIQPLCFSCNSWKHARHMDFREVAA